MTRRSKDEAERKEKFDQRIQFNEKMTKSADTRVETGNKALEKITTDIEELETRFHATREEYEALHKRFYDADGRFLADMETVNEERQKQEEERKEKRMDARARLP